MAENDFIERFDASMRRLNEVRQGIQANIEMKQQFTNNIKDSLTQISRRLAALVGEITALKNRAEELDGHVNRNTTAINDKDRQYQELQAQIAQLQQQHDADVRALNEEKDRLTQQINGLQEQINTCEQNLREVTQIRDQLTNEKDQLTNERDALRNELQGRGDQANEHAQQIQQLTEQAQQREQALTDRINQCEARIAEFERQINEKDAEIARVNQEHQNTRGSAENQSQNLQQEITRLTQQNEQLSQRIVAATQAIMDATEDLERLTAAVPNATTQREVNAILQEIEQSLQNISNVIQGQHAAAAAPVAPVGQVAQGRLPDNTPINVIDYASGQPINVPLSTINQQLSRKAQQLRRANPNGDNKYQTALNQIANARTPEDVSGYLRGIDIRNSPQGITVRGGRRTKKNRKQKGGFTYKSTSIRRSISSTPKSTRRSRRSSR